jgi:hypothetical protein
VDLNYKALAAFLLEVLGLDLPDSHLISISLT